MTSPKFLWTAAVALAVVVALAALVYSTRGSLDDPRVLPSALDLGRDGPDAPGSPATAAPPSGSIAVRLAPGSVYVPAAGEPQDEPGTLPELVSGAFEVDFTEPVSLETLRLEPRTGSATISASVEGVAVSSGEVAAGESVYRPGDTLPRGLLPPWQLWGGSAPRVYGDAVVAQAGQVVDAETGQPLEGATVATTASHHPTGYPPLPDGDPHFATRTDRGGGFALPARRPSDARIHLYVEVTHEGYEPVAITLPASERDLDGRFPFAAISLRRGSTREIELLDPDGAPLAHAPCSIQVPVDPFLSQAECARWPVVGDGEWVVRYADAHGVLVVARADERIELLDPFLEPWDPAVNRPARCGVDPFGRREDEISVVHTAWRSAQPHELVDQLREPISNALLEVERVGYPTYRLYTGEDGGFDLAPRIACGDEDRVDLEHPEHALLRVLSPRHFRVETTVAIPSAVSIVTLPARTLGALRFRAVTAESDGTVVPLPPQGVRLGGGLRQDMTLVERSAGGDVLYEGPLPDTGERFVIDVAGALPATVAMPPHAPGSELVDLGDVRFELGLRVEVRLAPPPPPSRLARLWVRSAGVEDEGHFHGVRADGTATLGGLVHGGRYQTTIDVAGTVIAAGEFRVSDEHVRDGLAIELPSRPERIVVTGHTPGVAPEAAGTYRVQERFHVAGEVDPVSYPSYPLPPDGRFGSVREFPGAVENVEVFVLGPRSRFGHARVPLGADACARLGSVAVSVPCIYTFTFEVSGGVPVSIPRDLRLYAERLRNHEAARMFSDDGFTLIVENLLPGRYLMRWGGDGADEEGVGFVVPEDGAADALRLTRRPPVEAEVLLALVDEDGAPVRAATIASSSPHATRVARDLLTTAGREIAPGVYAVTAWLHAENRVAIEADGALPVILELATGEWPRDPFVVRRGVEIDGLLLGVDGLPFDGSVSLRWSDSRFSAPPFAASRRVVSPATIVRIRRGLLQGPYLPEGQSYLLLEDTASNARHERLVVLSGGRVNPIPGLQLLEGRSLRGTVSYPDGAPVVGARVEIVDPEHALRLPFEAIPRRAAYFATTADGAGSFQIDGLPIDFDRDLSLVAHARGFTDAVVPSLDPRRDEYSLELLDETELLLRADYLDGGDHPGYEFRLEYNARLDGLGDYRDLGPVPEASGDVRRFAGIAPGVYRLLWRLAAAPAGTWLESREVVVAPLVRSELRLTIRGRRVHGRAIFRGKPLAAGAVEVTLDPGTVGGTRRAPVNDGEFQLLVPEGTEWFHAALIPPEAEGDALSWERGEALPRERMELPRDADEPITIRYDAYDLTIRIPADLRKREPRLIIEFPHWRWAHGRFERESRQEEIDGESVRLRLLEPGEFSFSIRAPHSWTRSVTIELDDDLEYPFRR